MQKLVTAFIQKLPKEIKSDGCIHGRFNQIGAKTLRFSSSDPNMQNISARISDVRTMFKAREGCILIGSDYS